MPVGKARERLGLECEARMSWQTRGVGLLLLVVLGTSGKGAEPAEVDANWNHLHSMPRKQREELRENLKRFDAMSPQEQAAIRRLRQRLDELEPSERDRYVAVMRRYHIWFRSLSKEKQEELAKSPVKERIQKINELRSKEQAAAAPRRGARAPLSTIQMLDFGRIPLYELAHLLKIWQALSPDEKANAERLLGAPQAERFTTYVSHVGEQKNIAPPDHPSALELETIVKRNEDQKKKFPGAALLKGVDRRLAERLKKARAFDVYFINHPPKDVDSEKLFRFEASLPPWARGLFEPLPAEEARRRLRILYRLIYGANGEMPEPQPTAPAPKPTRTAPPATTTPVKPTPNPSINPF
jgi:hypothetical protein